MAEKTYAAECADKIEAAVYNELKKYGFKKYGRTLHRFVSDDISQVIDFQCGQAFSKKANYMCVNIGIRIPECFEREFMPSKPCKKYYHEYECSIRSRLGSIDGNNAKWFNLKKNFEKTAAEIIDDVKSNVIPVFDLLSSREAILAERRNYAGFDMNQDNIFLDEAMIYGHLGNIEKAKELFEKHYRLAVDEYNDKMINGTEHYLKKGERICFMGQDITAKKDGYVTVYGANHGHIDYLDELAVKLGIREKGD